MMLLAYFHQHGPWREKSLYGAGEVKIWDRGLYSFMENKPGKIKVALMGEKVKGAFLLVRRGREGPDWLMLKFCEVC